MKHLKSLFNRATVLTTTTSIAILLFSLTAIASGKAIPPSPTDYVYDESALLSPSEHSELSQTLSHEETAATNQVIVAIFKSLDDEDLVDYTNRVFQAWKIGQKSKNNGVLLAIYLKEKKIRIEVGYGLEPVLTDAQSKGIILNQIAPAFRQNQYGAGVMAATQQILKVIHQEFGATEAQNTSSLGDQPNRAAVLAIFIVFAFFMFIRRLGGVTISRRGRYYGNGFGGGGFSGGGGFGDGGGGGFSGGGGSSGGGGASGGW